MVRTPVPYIDDLPDDQAQPIVLDHQEPFVVIKQCDGADPEAPTNWVLVRQDELDDFILRLQAMKK